jgi:hypothetical protein
MPSHKRLPPWPLPSEDKAPAGLREGRRATAGRRSKQGNTQQLTSGVANSSSKSKSSSAGGGGSLKGGGNVAGCSAGNGTCSKEAQGSSLHAVSFDW